MYIPIFSKDIEKFENKKISVIGKVVDIQEEKKLLRIKLLDPFGYINVVFFEYFDIKLFDTVLVLGKISKYNNNFSIVGKYIVKLNEQDEILWRRFFIKKKKKVREKKEIKINDVEKKEEKKVIEEKPEKNIKKEERGNIIDKEYKEDIRDLEERNKNKIEFIDEIEDKNIKLRKEILEFIRNNDKGDGVSFNDILNFFDINEEKLTNILKDLLSSGEIYESSPNKYKII
jgi:DNA-dependent RNA polymerase auxiliary subunit epsilon